ncbi:AmmeMemoRadiSam system protein B [Planctomycetota bacterium]
MAQRYQLAGAGYGKALLVPAAIIIPALVFLAYVVIGGKLSAGNGDGEKKIKAPAVAGTFYPGSAKKLSAEIDRYLKNAKAAPVTNLKALVSPHAGYPYSAPIAAYGYSLLPGRDFSTVIVIGPSHHAYLEGASIPDVTHLQTPLGLVEVSPKVKKMLAEELIADIPAAYAKEHSVEVQIPFLQKVLGDFKIIPIVVGDVDPEKFAAILDKYIDDKTLVVASSDFSHGLPYEDATKIDKFNVRAIVNGSPSLFNLFGSSCRPCGRVPIAILSAIAAKRGWAAKALDYRNSGDTTGDPSGRIVGYASIAFYQPAPGEEPVKESFGPLPFTEAEKTLLLQLARTAIKNHLERKDAPTVAAEKLTGNLRAVRGTFVTLEINGRLRGCIGNLAPLEELYQNVINNAVSAAVNDRRFARVTLEDLPKIDIKISVLSLPQKLQFNSPKELLDQLTPGTDGVILIIGHGRSTYLPQVWEMLPDKEEFLSRLSSKAGMAADAWKQPGTKVFTYRAQVFGEIKKSEK